jgi:hypothetical protein
MNRWDTPAVSLSGAAVKLRRLCDPELGLAPDQIGSLQHVLAIVEETKK